MEKLLGTTSNSLKGVISLVGILAAVEAISIFGILPAETFLSLEWEGELIDLLGSL